MSYLAGRPDGRQLADQQHYAPHLQPSAESQFIEKSALYMASTCHFATQGRGLGLLDYQEMPSAVAADLPRFFGLELSEQKRMAMLASAKFYSKDGSAKIEFDRQRELSQRVPPSEVTEVAERIVWPEIRRLQQTHPHIPGTEHAERVF